MHYYTIPPFEHLELDTVAQHYLVVAQWVEQSEALLHFYQRRAKEGASIILDNGVHEYRTVYPIEKYLAMAKDIGVEVIVAPDVWGDADGTVEAALDFYHSLSVGEQDMVMGVPHGKNLFEFMQCFSEMDEFNIIGLSKDEWGDKTGYIRPWFTHFMGEEDANTDRFHLLGLTHIKELLYCNPQTTRSFDTSLPWKAAMMNIKINGECSVSGEYKVRDVMTPQQQKIAQFNLNELRYLAQKSKTNLWKKIS